MWGFKQWALLVAIILVAVAVGGAMAVVAGKITDRQKEINKEKAAK